MSAGTSPAECDSLSLSELRNEQQGIWAALNQLAGHGSSGWAEAARLQDGQTLKTFWGVTFRVLPSTSTSTRS